MIIYGLKFSDHILLVGRMHSSTGIMPLVLFLLFSKTHLSFTMFLFYNCFFWGMDVIWWKVWTSVEHCILVKFKWKENKDVGPWFVQKTWLTCSHFWNNQILVMQWLSYQKVHTQIQADRMPRLTRTSLAVRHSTTLLCKSLWWWCVRYHFHRQHWQTSSPKLRVVTRGPI